MTIEHEAFIDLEQALHRRTEQLWMKHWRGLRARIMSAANNEDWETAFRLCDEINFTPIAEKLSTLARTMAEAALFLGASRFDSPQKASFYGNPDEDLLDRAVAQWSVVLTRNAQEALRIQAKNLVAELEMAYQEARLQRIVKSDLDKVGKSGALFSQATASLMISRMSTMGFMLEGVSRGIREYRVNEVMDAATCGICAEMHNKHFPVADGFNMISSLMMSSDPESMKAMTPFQSQSQANVKRISQMGQGQLISAGLNLPPYHPNCRGIVTLEEKNRVQPAALGGLAMGERMLDSGDMSPDELGAMMFGDFDGLDDQFLALALGAGAAADFYTE